MRAFKYRAVVAGTALGLAIGSVLYGATVILPQYVQGLLNFPATLSGSFSTAALVTLLARRNSFHQEILVQHTNLSRPAIRELLAAHRSIGNLYGIIVAQASALSFADAQLALGALAFILMPLIFLLPQRRSTRERIEIPAE